MSVTCNDLLNLEIFKSIEPVAGKNGLDNVITWPFVAQTETVSDWLNGGELLFVTGIAHEVDNLPELLEECISKRLAGLVVLIGEEYIESLPSELVTRAEEADFPLFTMPWELKLLDVTKEITNLIMYEQLERKKTQRLVSHIIFTPPSELEPVIDSAQQENMQPEGYCFVAIFSLASLHVPEEKLPPEEKLQHNIGKMCALNHISVYTMLYGNRVLCLFNDLSKERMLRSMEYLKGTREALGRICGDEKLLLAIGEIHKGLQEARQSYHEALSTMTILQRMSGKLIADYRSLGIYRLLVQVQDQDELHQFCRHQLGALIDYGTFAGVDLLDTLHLYLDCQCNVSQMANKLGVHRNTANYRMSKIKELLGKNLEDPMVVLELSMAFVIKEYLEELK